MNEFSIGEMTIGYVSGYIIRSVLKTIKFCKVCKNDCVDNSNENKLINARNYSKPRLYNPSSNMNTFIEHILFILSRTITQFCNTSSVFTKIEFLIDTNVELNFSCQIHDLKNIIKTKVINFFLFNWCKNINQILRGIDTKVHNNPIKKLARDYYIHQKLENLDIINDYVIYNLFVYN